MTKRLYSLYERPRGRRVWKRASDYAYTKNLAVRVFQSRLLDHLLAGDMSIERRLRVVSKFDIPSAR